MSLESDILNDLQQLLQEHGVQARWNGINVLVLVSRNRNEQQLDIGGFVGSPDLSLRVPNLALPMARTKLLGRMDIDGVVNRITSHFSLKRFCLAREHFF
jgi:hypothetical protein